MIMQNYYNLFICSKGIKVLCVLFVFLLSLNSLKAQNRTTDSLLTLLKKDKADTSKVNHSNKVCKEYINIGLYDTALHHSTAALQLSQKLNFKNGIASSYHNIGLVYYYQGDYPKALDCYLKALKMAEELGDKEGIANRLGNIGLVYSNQGDYPKALDYCLKALKMANELGDKKNIAIWLGSIGSGYSKQGGYPKALDYYFKALKMAEELGDKRVQAYTLSNIGTVYFNQADYSKALDYDFNALKIAEELGDKRKQANTLSNIGWLYFKTGKFKEAEQYINRAIAINYSIGELNSLMSAEESLTTLYDTIGRHKEALFHYKKAMALKDTIFSQENKKELVRKEMNYEFDKKEAATKAENEKQQAIAEEKSRKQKLVLVLVSCVLILVFVFAAFIFRTLRITRKQKQIIEIKNTETELQKKTIEEKNKDITASIHYAKHIQNALLREEEHVSMHLPDHFILFLPKDIVSGDFYWGAEKQDCWYFAAVDCTGHGVPGAVMSMLGISFLNDIVTSEQMLSPAEVLNRLRHKIMKELRQTGEADGNKDGMDISLARLNMNTNELEWAGANNSLNLIRNGQLEIIKANKQPIGYHPQNNPFTNHKIQLQKGDSIYLYSDGYADQFGGPKGKKFKYKQLENLLIENNHLSLKEQKEILKNQFIGWKGSLEQIDDVCVFGVRI